MSRPRSLRTCPHPDAPGPTRNGDCSACSQARRRREAGAPTRRAPGLVALPSVRVAPEVRERYERDPRGLYAAVRARLEES